MSSSRPTPYQGKSLPDSSAASTASESIMAIDTVRERKKDSRGEREDEERTALIDAGGSNTPEVSADYGSIAPSVPGRAPRRKYALARRARYYIPSLAWIPQYNWSLLGGDILAGLTVGCILIPQSISYASSLAKLSPVTGLISASIPGIIYAFLGTSRQLNVAPEAALSLLLGQAIQEIRHEIGDPPEGGIDVVGLAVSSVINFQVGLICFLLGFFRLGFIDVVLSRALLRGFISAVAVVILVEQLIPMFGLTQLMRVVGPHTTLQKIAFIWDNVWEHSNQLTMVISFGALGSLVLFRMFKNQFQKTWWIYRLPEVLIVVVLSTYISGKVRWDKGGVDILGAVSVSTGDHFFQFPLANGNFKFVRATTSTAVLIAVAGFLDSIVAAKQNAARFGHSISPNRELVALGASNLVASFVPGTLSAFGSITRSRINGDVGGRTQMASIVCSLVVLFATFFLLPWLYYLPKCVLGAVITLVVYSLFAETPHDVMYYWKMGAWVDLAIMTMTFTACIVWNLEAGIVISMVLSLLLVVHRSSKTRMTILGRIPGTDRWKPLKDTPEAEEAVSGVLIVRIRESLDFANTSQLKERLRRLELYGPHKHHPSERPTRQEASVLIFHMADVDSVDASAAQILYELTEEYMKRDVQIFMTHVKAKPYQTFVKAGIVDMVGLDAFRETVADAVSIVERSAAPSRV
ncbi:endoplasmic reticulum protein [Coprinopsis cinerea okayama7|uniref:Endoplasmic reticulum protein n=1 Tax=Coprinopsis cinerea (strain Okayama-7 / 130 / ATCC MYA-4618 / FGSC 9003) TaxID=240176 RepID=A8NZ22_COPC7|nr:endoplasmic reticulum protein [Coprinopsis cinerea okayama7\|eukprot:XP_001837584.2 endoplasmic reticulum protein [Coprinopsis cinerea okayama7\